jgi:hypothetical protein
VEYYNQQRPHQSLGDLPPAARFTPKPTVEEPAPGGASRSARTAPGRSGSRATSALTAWPASLRNRSASASIQAVTLRRAGHRPAPAVLDRGRACQDRDPDPAPDRSARRTPQAPAHGDNVHHGVSRINRHTSVKHHPKAYRPTPSVGEGRWKGTGDGQNPDTCTTSACSLLHDPVGDLGMRSGDTSRSGVSFS